VSVVYGTTANVAGAAIRNFRIGNFRIGPSLSNRIESGHPIRIRIWKLRRSLCTTYLGYHLEVSQLPIWQNALPHLWVFHWHSLLWPCQHPSPLTTGGSPCDLVRQLSCKKQSHFMLPGKSWWLNSSQTLITTKSLHKASMSGSIMNRKTIAPRSVCILWNEQHHVILNTNPVESDQCEHTFTDNSQQKLK